MNRMLKDYLTRKFMRAAAISCAVAFAGAIGASFSVGRLHSRDVERVEQKMQESGQTVVERGEQRFTFSLIDGYESEMHFVARNANGIQRPGTFYQGSFVGKPDISTR